MAYVVSNNIYKRKKAGKTAWNYVCRDCKHDKRDSISIRVKDNTPVMSFKITYLQLVHKYAPMTDDQFSEKNFIRELRILVVEQPLVPLQQLYDRFWVEYQATGASLESMCGYRKIRSSLKRLRRGVRFPRLT
jgi:hypothetical protein